jgi:hypothetical protein
MGMVPITVRPTVRVMHIMADLMVGHIGKRSRFQKKSPEVTPGFSFGSVNPVHLTATLVRVQAHASIARSDVRFPAWS